MTATTIEQSEKKSPPKYDPRNKLNDLSNVEWLISTKSVWRSEGLDPEVEGALRELSEKISAKYGVESSAELLEQSISSVIYSKPPPRDSLKEKHPATFPEGDIEELIKFFTKEGDTVLDPFVGVGSTLIASMNTWRSAVGIELIGKWVDLARKRIEHAKSRSPAYQHGMEQFTSARELRRPPDTRVLQGDSRSMLREMTSQSFDFIVTSPPYWAILRKDKDHKARHERIEKGLPTKYSEEEADLGNVSDYREFLGELSKIFVECHRVLKDGKYMCVIVTDFRHKSKFITYHSDLASHLEKVGFTLEGITILVQDSKTLYPYGMPYAFVSNIHHQYILVFRKNGTQKSDTEGLKM